ncbi:unnamed protein product, partial [Durusdinium trenchii]
VISDRALRFLQMREAIWKKTSEEALVLREFEGLLHRHYFHHKPLSLAQLDAWRRYLDFEESRTPRNWRRLQGLFERCLIVTNNYLEFWLRYASLLEQAEATSNPGAKPELACSLLRGACLSGRLARRPDALAAWAELEEECGRTLRSRIILDGALAGCGRGSADLALRRCGLELRQQDGDLAAALLESFAANADLSSRAILSRRHARLCEELGHPEKAYESLLAAWQAGCRQVGLLVELSSLTMRGHAEKKGEPGSAVAKCITLFEEALQCAEADGHKFGEVCELWSCYVDFLLAHGAPLGTTSHSPG